MTNVLKHLPPVHLHPVFWAFTGIAILTGTFVEWMVIFSIVLIHELGHFVMAKHFKWRVNKIMLWVFGGVMDTDEHGGRPIKEELLVVLAGPMQHIWMYGLIFFASSFTSIPPSLLDLAFDYNTTILIFNLLPIWPLDGGKMCLLWLSLLLPYRKAHSLTIVCSIIICVSGVILYFMNPSFTLSAVLLISFILWENRLEWKQRYYVFLRFLMKRHKNNCKIGRISPIIVKPETTIIQIFSLFRRNYRHYIQISSDPKEQQGTMDEQKCLDTFFMDKNYTITAREMLDQNG
ncbi:M50 family metallopeptidase [Aquibacillus sp. 3ASR75-11]|uniref:M50 family metallopeptidase n=1 Tax=Terrihalobacillus insolitus TaxID=2950438 RepID=A0A9X3WTZ6_9BACI|nr:M50 family metallopeptidase [Terrihalobacillus insolitus]MDC3412466.1 M50 family metallopeptidase [Terrihalobacillus insolitus]MDC3423886.1 M50 family metallopeptidase [Terrihalobacillus insolitus]